jgi:hypothetical protein
MNPWYAVSSTKGPHPGINSTSSKPRSLPFNLKFASTEIYKIYRNLPVKTQNQNKSRKLKLRKRFLHKWASLPPIFRKVSPWVRTSRTFHRQAARKCLSNPVWIMSPSRAFESHHVSPDSENPMELLVSILEVSRLAPSTRYKSEQIIIKPTIESETFALSVFRSSRW